MKKCISGICGECKRCYDRIRRQKIKAGSWDFNINPPKVLNDIQYQVMIGGLLGDSYLYLYEHHINAGLAIGRSSKDKEYLEYQFEVFKNFCSVGIKDKVYFDKRTLKTYYNSYFRTVVCEPFTILRKEWYPEGIKIVPKSLKLTPLICAIWFCDDGTICKQYKNSLRIALSTDGFKKSEVKFLKHLLLDEIKIPFSITKKPNREKDEGYYLYISRKEYIKTFVNYISPVFPVSMKRKSDIWKEIFV